MGLPIEIIQNQGKNLSRFFAVESGKLSGYIFRLRRVVIQSHPMRDPTLNLVDSPNFEPGTTVLVLECLPKIWFKSWDWVYSWMDFNWIMYHEYDQKNVLTLAPSTSESDVRVWLTGLIGENIEISGSNLGKWAWGQDLQADACFQLDQTKSREAWTAFLEPQFKSLMTLFASWALSPHHASLVSELFSTPGDIWAYKGNLRPRKFPEGAFGDKNTLIFQLSEMGDLGKGLFDLWVLDLLLWWFERLQAKGLNISVVPLHGRVTEVAVPDLGEAINYAQGNYKKNVKLAVSEAEIRRMLLRDVPASGVSDVSRKLQTKIYRGPPVFRNLWFFDLKSRETLEFCLDRIGFFSKAAETLQATGHGLALTKIGKRTIWLPGE